MFSQEVLNNVPDLDKQIETAFDFCDGSIVKYENNNDWNTTIDSGNIWHTSHARILLTTDNDTVYYIPFEYLIKDKKHPENEGLYNIRIMQMFFNEYYYYAENDANKLNILYDELPHEAQRGKPDMGYKQHGLGVYTYSLDDIQELYYKKNGKIMQLYDGNNEYETVNEKQK